MHMQEQYYKILYKSNLKKPNPTREFIREVLRDKYLKVLGKHNGKIIVEYLYA